MRGLQAPTTNPCFEQVRLEPLDEFRWPRGHAQLVTVDGGQRQTGGQAGANLAVGQADAEHPTRRQGLDQPPAFGDQVQSIFGHHHAGHAGRSVLADTVPHDRCGGDAPLLPQAGESVFHDEDRDLSVGGLPERRGGVGRRIGIENHPMQVYVATGHQTFRQRVEDRAKARPLLPSLASHSQALGALAGETEHHARCLCLRRGAETDSRIAAPKQPRGRRRIVGGDYPPLRVRGATELQGIGDVGHGFRRSFEIVRQPATGRVERLRSLSREGEQQRALQCRPLDARRCLFEHDVGVGATDAEGTHASPQRRSVRLPFPQLGIDEHRAGGEIDFGVRVTIVDGRRDRPIFQHQHRLDETGDAGGRVQVADVRFDRTDGAKLLLVRGHAEGAGDTGDFDRVAEMGSGAVRLDVADGFRIDVRQQLRHSDRFGLTLDAWGGVPDLERPIVVDRRTTDDRTDAVARRQGIFEPFQHHDARSVALNRSLGQRVERPAVAVRRKNTFLDVDITDSMRGFYRHPAG